MGPTNKKLIFLWLSPSPPYSLLPRRLANNLNQEFCLSLLANLQRSREYGGEVDNQRKISFLFVGPISSYLGYIETNYFILFILFGRWSRNEQICPAYFSPGLQVPLKPFSCKKRPAITIYIFETWIIRNSIILRV